MVQFLSTPCTCIHINFWNHGKKFSFYLCIKGARESEHCTVAKLPLLLQLPLLSYTYVYLRLVKVFITPKPNTMWRQHLHPLTSLDHLQKAFEAHSCKPWETNLSVVPHTLGILTTNITYCIILHVLEYINERHVNGCVV